MIFRRPSGDPALEVVRREGPGSVAGGPGAAEMG